MSAAAKISASILVVALIGLAAYTNPTMDDFSNYVRQEIVLQGQKQMQEPVGQLFASIFGGIAGGIASNQTVRTDYIVFSTYNLQFGKERFRAVGLFRNFILLEKPDMKRIKKSMNG